MDAIVYDELMDFHSSGLLWPAWRPEFAPLSVCRGESTFVATSIRLSSGPVIQIIAVVIGELWLASVRSSGLAVVGGCLTVWAEPVPSALWPDGADGVWVAQLAEVAASFDPSGRFPYKVTMRNAHLVRFAGLLGVGAVAKDVLGGLVSQWERAIVG